MRYLEFKKVIENIGKKYDIELSVSKDIDETYIYLTQEKPWIISTVSNQARYESDSCYGLMGGLEEHIRGEIFQAITKFANTPIKDRGYEKRYIVPLPFLMTTDGKQQYLTQRGTPYLEALLRNVGVQIVDLEGNLRSTYDILNDLAQVYDTLDDKTRQLLMSQMAGLNGNFFASRRDENLRQTWKEEHLVHIPECYRKYAIEWEGQ